MPDLASILARTRDDEIMKIVFGVGAVVVWGIFQLIAAVAKKAEENKRRMRYNRLPEDVASRGGFPVPPPVPVQQRPKPVKKAKAARGGGRPVPAAVRSEGGRAATVAYEPPVVDVPKRAVRQTVGTAEASRIGRLVRQPASLRAALVLNEVLSKPIALRDGGEGR